MAPPAGPTPRQDDFDRSFDYFESSKWSDWKNDANLEHEVSSGPREDETSVFDPFAGASAGVDTVPIAITEQLSALYDDVSSDPTWMVDGAVYLQPRPELAGLPFLLTLRDVLGHVNQLSPNTDLCEDVSDKIARQGLHRSDRVLRVRLAANTEDHSRGGGGKVLLTSYQCSKDLRPVPLLVKGRVQVSPDGSRAGFKIRANPRNDHCLANLAIVLAVPPHVRGDTVKMSRRGGVWDEMKRTISWTMEQLEPGQALEVQLQFEADDRLEREPKFPILVRAEYPILWSGVQLHSEFTDGVCAVVPTKCNVSSRVLHRKV